MHPASDNENCTGQSFSRPLCSGEAERQCIERVLEEERACANTVGNAPADGANEETRGHCWQCSDSLPCSVTRTASSTPAG